MQPRRAQRRDQHERHCCDAGRRADGERPAQAVVDLDVGELPGPVRQRKQGDDDDEVGEHGAPRRGQEPPPGVEHGVGESGCTVEEDLQQEDPRQQCADPLDQLRIDAFLRVHRVQTEDQRRGEHGDDGEHGHRRQRHRDDDVGGPIVVIVQELGEQRHQRGRQHSTDEQFIDDVRRLVADQIDVGQRALADDVAEHHHAQQPGEARQRGARGDDEVGPQQPGALATALDARRRRLRDGDDLAMVFEVVVEVLEARQGGPLAARHDLRRPGAHGTSGGGGQVCVCSPDNRSVSSIATRNDSNSDTSWSTSCPSTSESPEPTDTSTARAINSSKRASSSRSRSRLRVASVDKRSAAAS